MCWPCTLSIKSLPCDRSPNLRMLECQFSPDANRFHLKS
ncbi:rCG55715 [Rattus norvegicus]|uniref:RCG55715 n=1 Tax=Rattus norvegicus TaxID=10116 RepID=A6JM52_RAT|nr:rCG55715 [Rattus norvegicus]